MDIEMVDVDKENAAVISDDYSKDAETHTVESVDADAISISSAWEYETGLNQWVRFGDQLTDELNGCAPDGVVKTTVDESELHLDVSSMKQINMITGFRRNIRCVVAKDGSDEYHVWEAIKGRKYVPLPRALQLELEKTRAANKESSVVFTNSSDYVSAQIDTMHIKTAQEKDVKLRRSLSSAESAMSAQPAPTAERTRGYTRRGAKSVDYKKEVKEEEPEEDYVPTTKKSRGSRRAQKEEGDDDDEEKVPAKKSSAKSGPTKSTKRTLLMKGRAPVDPECTEKVKIAHILEEGDNIWDAMLNQTNISNNNNKFYILQLLEDDDLKSKNYSVWFRWGRVGYTGQSNLQGFGGDLDAAKECFCKKFSDKTRNEWAERADFESCPGKYTMIHMDYSVPAGYQQTGEGLKEEEEDGVDGEEVLVREESQLDERVQSLMSLICNVQAMEEAVMEMEYDSAKAPLGKLTTDQISEGYRLLGEIEKFINKKQFDRQFVNTVNEYYTKVPHSFGFRQPPLIKTAEMLEKENELLEMLEEIEIAIRTLGGGNKKGDRRAAVDVHYENMKCGLKALDEDEQEYKMVSDYLKTTHAVTHMYSMKIRNVFAVDREGECETFQKDLGNRQLLWHGSRLTNWYGILSKGLRIAPPEAPSCGYMFGKGVYFADMASKSGNYCYPSKGKSGILMLAEVALGAPKVLRDADYNADKLPKGLHSTLGEGRTQPDPQQHITLEDGVVVPCGRPVKRGDGSEKYSLLYNEYVVYDTTQIRMRYAVEVDFDM